MNSIIPAITQHINLISHTQDFKTAHLLGVAPSSQLVAMLVGSAASVPLSVAAYMLYTSAWQVCAVGWLVVVMWFSVVTCRSLVMHNSLTHNLMSGNFMSECQAGKFAALCHRCNSQPTCTPMPPC